MIDIRNIKGEVQLSTPINEGSRRKFELMKEDYITLKFSLETPILFGLGCNASCEFGTFEVTDIQKPTYNERTGGYDYELRLNAHYWKWKNKIFKFTPETAGQEASWNLTATLDVHAGIILRNLKALGYSYKGTEYSFSIDSSVENKPQLMSYSNISILDALFEMAKKWDCECWITDSIIHFGKLEFSTPVNFEIGKNVESMSRSDSKNSFATRLYVFGSEKNLPTGYRKAEQDMLVNGVVQKRLMLPEGTPCIDAYPGMTESEAIEQVIVFDNVFPKTECVVGKVESYTSTIKDESTENPDDTITETFYYVTDTSGFVFKKEYILEGEELSVQFQSGRLNGLQFGCTFRAKGEMLDGKELQSDVYEIVANEDYGRKLPDKTLLPATGDKFILIGWDSTKIGNTSLITTAENKLKEEGEKRMEKMKVDPSTYSCKMMSNTIYAEDGLHQLYEAGQKVNLVNKAYFENGRISRIIGFEYALDIPYDSPSYIVGETPSYSRIGELEEKIDELTLSGQTYTGGSGGGVYLIKTNDSTPPSESNTYSARRILKELSKLLRKDKPDETNYLIKLLGGAEFDKIFKSAGAIDSMIAGKGVVLDTERGLVQADRLEVRSSMTVMEMIINRLQAMEGDYSFSDNGTIEQVELMPDGTYRLWLQKRWDNDFTSLHVNDVIYGQTRDLGKGAYEYYTSWMRVVHVDTAANVIDVVLYPDKEVPGGKNYLPVELMVISRRGNPVDEDRQAYWYLSSNEHCICMLDGVTKPILEEANYSVIVGRLKQLSLFENLPINYLQSYVYCRGIATQDIMQIDYQGTVTKKEVNRLFWSLETAQNEPYLNTKEVYHVVSHYGCEWMCLVSNTLQEPKFGCTDWAMIRGNPAFNIDIESSEGWGEFDVETFETTLTVKGFMYNQEVSSDIQDADVSWSRDSGNVHEDNAWTVAHAGYGKVLRINKDELGPNYLTLRRCNFKATALLRDGQETKEANDIIYF